VVGYQYGVSIAFGFTTANIDEYYADGVTLTHGPVGAREHIWTFATGRQESFDNNALSSSVCPCVPNANPSIVVPPFVGEDYFCESGALNVADNQVFYDDPLWDGDGCIEGNSCCTLNDPPYFTRQLPASTSDDIELRDCGLWRSMIPESTYSQGDTLIQLIELYVK
jgi:hypothetical protein